MHSSVERKLDYEFKGIFSSHNLATTGLQTSNSFLLNLSQQHLMCLRITWEAVKMQILIQ